MSLKQCALGGFHYSHTSKLGPSVDTVHGPPKDPQAPFAQKKNPTRKFHKRVRMLFQSRGWKVWYGMERGGGLLDESRTKEVRRKVTGQGRARARDRARARARARCHTLALAMIL